VSTTNQMSAFPFALAWAISESLPGCLAHTSSGMASKESDERLRLARARLQESLAGLALLRSAAGEFSTTLARFRGVVPRK